MNAIYLDVWMLVYVMNAEIYQCDVGLLKEALVGATWVGAIYLEVCMLSLCMTNACIVG